MADRVAGPFAWQTAWHLRMPPRTQHPPRSWRHFGDAAKAPLALVAFRSMPGRQLNFAIKGEQYEKAFDSIGSGFLSVVRTPRPEDYGIDAFCHLRLPWDAVSSTVGGTFGVQVHGRGADLEFGGVANGKWKSYEIEWLRSLAVPLYLARVSEDWARIDLYSLWPVWIVLAQSRTPFRIICQCDEPESDPHVLQSVPSTPNLAADAANGG